MTRSELQEEMLEFGMSPVLAEKMSRVLLPLFNDPRGLREAFVDAFPAEAEKRGLRRRQ